MASNAILFEVAGPVAWLTFNRPEAHNAMTWEMYEGLFAACERVDTDDAIRALVIRGAGEKAFVAGTDIAQFKAFGTAQDGIEYEAKLDRIVGRLEDVRKPTIALVRGYAVGGGVMLAVACDLRYCSPEARFGAPIARTVGNCLSLTNHARLVELIGPARTKALLYTAELVDAEAALAAGLVNEVVPRDQLEARVGAVAERIASNAPLTLQITKESIRRLRERTRPEGGDDLVALAYTSADFHEGVDAFLAKRPPVWRGR